MKDTHGHPILTWYNYDEVHRVEVRQGDRKLDRFFGYETEDDIKRALRTNEHFGEFEVIGIDNRGNYLPHRGEIVVARPGRSLKGFLARTKHYRATDEGDDEPRESAAEAERQRQLARERAALMRKSEELFEERLEEKERLFEERRREIEEAAEERARIEASRADRIEEQSSVVLDQLRDLYESRVSQVSESSNLTQSILTTTLTAQVKQAQSEAAMWRDRYDRLEDTYNRFKQDERDREDRSRMELERERMRLREDSDREKESAREKVEALETRLRSEHKAEVDKLESRIETLKEEKDNLKEEMRDMNQTILQLQLMSRMEAKGGLSSEAKELRDLLGVAKEHNIDVKEIVRDRLGLPEVENEKKGPLDMAINAILPKLMGGELSQPTGDGNQESPQSPTQGLHLEPI
jgi:chromosome segregation ATPase